MLNKLRYKLFCRFSKLEMITLAIIGDLLLLTIVACTLYNLGVRL